MEDFPYYIIGPKLDSSMLEGENAVLRGLLGEALPWFEEAAADEPDPEALPRLQAIRDGIRAALARKPGALL